MMAFRVSLLLAPLLLIPRVAGSSPPPSPAVPPPTGEDRVLAATRVPSRTLAQGEVRLVRRQGIPLVQTVLHTRFLDRVTRSIEKKEETNWPAGRPGAPSSRDYLDALARARDKAASAPDSSIRTLVIEIVPRGTNSYAAFYQASVDPRPHAEWVVSSPALIEAIPLSSMYAEDNSRLILDDTFGRDAESVKKRLEEP